LPAHAKDSFAPEPDIAGRLGTKPLSMQQARAASKLLNVHWTSVYRLRRRFLANPVASAVAPNARRPKVGGTHLAKAEEVLDDILRRTGS
jgi:putative transposase